MMQLNIVHKYGKTAGVAATRSLNDRHWGLAADFALRLLRVLVLVALWRTQLPAKGVVSGMTLDSVLTYTLISQAFTTQFASQNGLDEDLWSGNIANRFLRPIGIHGQIVAEMVGGWLPNLCLFTLPLLLLAPILDIDPLPATVTAGIWFLVSLLLSVSTGTALGVIHASCVVFFEHNIYGLQRIRDAFILLLSGAVVPLALLPWELGEYLQLLPFASLASAPLRLYTDTGSPQSGLPGLY